MEEGAVNHRDAQPTKAHAQDHVVSGINAVASALTGEKSPDGFSAEDHASSSCDIAVAISAQAIPVALSQDHGFTGVVATKQVPEPGDAN